MSHKWRGKPNILKKFNQFDCPKCKRSVRVYWGDVEPKRVVLRKGDEDAGHTGETIGMQMGETSANSELYKDLFGVP